MSMGTLYVLGEVSVLVLYPFFNWIVFPIWSGVSSLYILEIRPLSEVSLANMFSHKVGSFFILKVASFSFFFLRFYLFILRERGKEGEKEGEKHQCVAASCASPTGDLACNPGMCPDWELNRRPFGWQAGTLSSEPHQPGLMLVSLVMLRLFSLM